MLIAFLIVFGCVLIFVVWKYRDLQRKSEKYQAKVYEKYG